MKCTLALLVACAAVSPIEKTLQLLGDLQAKIIKEGEAEQKIYEEFTDYCNDDSKETQFEIKTGVAAVERGNAAIAKEAAIIQSTEAAIQELSTNSATATADLKSASEIRASEKADFTKVDADLSESIDMIGRAIGIIEKEMSKNSFVQIGGMAKVSNALSTLLDAASVNALDKVKVQALLQAQSGEAEDDLSLQPGGAPDPAAYKSQGGGIVSALEDMLEKAKAEHSAAQKAEMNAEFDFKMLKQKLEDAIANGEKELAEKKTEKAAAEEAKATAEGQVAADSKNLADDKTHLKDLQHECMSEATRNEESQTARGEELEALGQAKKILAETTGGAADRSYSFLQVGSSTRVMAKTEDVRNHVLSMIQGMAKKDGSKMLALLSQRIESAQLMGADPFGKVKGMISEMIEKLVAEAAKEAAHKAFCDKEMSETKAKRDDKQADLDDLNTKIDTADAKIAKLSEEIRTLEQELGEIDNAQRKATEMRASENGAWTEAKTDLEAGVEGVGKALQVLRDYYAEKDESFMQTSKASGAAGCIIGMLEVVESDFSKNLAEGTAQESMPWSPTRS